MFPQSVTRTSWTSSDWTTEKNKEKKREENGPVDHV